MRKTCEKRYILSQSELKNGIQTHEGKKNHAYHVQKCFPEMSILSRKCLTEKKKILNCSYFEGTKKRGGRYDGMVLAT